VCEAGLACEKEKLQEALRSILVVGTFDKAAVPQVRCPLGDFSDPVPI